MSDSLSFLQQVTDGKGADIPQPQGEEKDFLDRFSKW